MKLRALVLLALTSAVLFAAGRAEPAWRPRYGGILRVEIGAVVNSIEPSVAAATQEEAAAKDEICALLGEVRRPEGAFAGVAEPGAFRIADWDPGKHLTLEASPSYRGGRAFVDSVEIELGRTSRDRLLDLEVDKADIVEIPPEEARQAADRGMRVAVSQPDQLVALVFVPGHAVPENAQVREALSRSIDRAAIVNFILQKEGEPAGGLLPQWSSGTAFLFPTTVDSASAKNLWAQITGSPKIALGYDANDSLEQSIAERIAVDAREAGGSVAAVALKPGASGNEDARLVRLGMASPNPRDALARFVQMLDPMAGVNANPPLSEVTPQQVYNAERAIVSTYHIVPLVWMPRAYGLSARIRDWKTPGPGEPWPFADVWLGGAQ
jgi:peptide/nickel transport system substrate-binding protein